jgi:hypothetical protein
MKSGISYFLFGLGMGMAGAILFTLKNGLETRNYIRSKALEGTEYLKQQRDNVRQQAAEKIESLMQNLQRPVDLLARAVDAGKRSYRERVESYSPQNMPLA